MIWLFKSAFWRTLGISLRRFPKDKRARRFVLISVGVLLYVGLYLRFFLAPFFFAQTRESQADRVIRLAFLGIMLSGALLVYLFHRWLERRDRLPSLLDDAAPGVGASPSEAETTEEIWRMTAMLAALLQRSGSEAAMQTTALAQGKEFAIRQWQRERLLALGLWEGLPVTFRDLLLLPEGHWTAAKQDAVNGSLEQFFAMRWAISLEDALRPLNQIPTYAGKAIVAMIAGAKPGNLALRPPWDLRLARDESYRYFERFWLEAVTRRLIGEEYEDRVLSEAIRLKAEIDANDRQSYDLLVGARTVSELDDETLMRMVITAHRRWEILKLLTGMAGGESRGSDLQALLLAPMSRAET